MNEDFFQNISSTGNPIEYADTVQRYQTQLPLGISWPTVTGSLNPGDLYTDDTSLYMYYPSGVNRTAIAIQQRDRYGGITFTLVSGSTNLYIQASEYFADPNPAFISSPYTVSGEGGTNLISASYSSDTPENPQNYWINLPNPGTYKVVFPNPVISTAFSVTHSGSSPYIFSQMLPRKSIGSYDIDVNSIRAYHVTASFIDAVAIQVSDSIVVGPDLIGAKSIDGSKIIDGTISGVLIQNGTVTGNKILAGTISGSLIQAGTITADNIASNTITASKIAGATITFNEIASNTLTAAQIADGAITGRKILDGTISGVLIQDDAISSSKIQANAITASKIAAGTITANEIAVSGITAINLQAGAVTADKISARVITAEKIVLSGITAELLGAEAVTAAALASGAVISGKIAAEQIYASHIVGGQITAYHVAANTITGDKIQANTISGALITAGTLTATQIAVSGITADRLNVTQLDAVAANMGSLTVNSGINIGASGYIWTGTGPAAEPTTGLKIYTTSGVSRLTTYAGGLAQVDIASNGKLLAGQGAVILDREGLTAGSTKLNSDGLTIGSISAPLQNKDALKIMSSGTVFSNGGISFINGAFSPTSAQATIVTDSTNNFVLSNNAPNGNLIIGNADTGNNNIYLYNSNVNIMPTVPGEAPGVYGYAKDGPGNNYLRYLLNTDGFYLFDDTYDQFNEPVANASIDRQTGNMRTIGDVEVLGNTTIAGNLSLSNGSVTDPSLTFNSDPNTGFYWSGADLIRVSTGGVQSAIFGAGRFIISNGSVGSPGLQFISDQDTGIYSVSADVLGIATGGAQRASISTTTANFTGKVTSNEMGYATIRRTTDVAITTAGTTITWQSVTRSGNISVPVPSDTITVDNAGYYMFSATFATVANLTSLRMTLVRGAVNYVSTLHGAGLGTGVGYIFNFSVGFWSTAGSTYKVILTPSANTTLIASAEATAGPSPIINIFQAIGV